MPITKLSRHVALKRKSELKRKNKRGQHAQKKCRQEKSYHYPVQTG